MNDASLVAMNNDESKIFFYKNQAINATKEVRCVSQEDGKEYVIPKGSKGYVFEDFNFCTTDSGVLVLFVNENGIGILTTRVSPYDIEDFFSYLYNN